MFSSVIMQPFPQEEPIDLLRRNESLLSCFCQSNEKKSFYLFFYQSFFRPTQIPNRPKPAFKALGSLPQRVSWGWIHLDLIPLRAIHSKLNEVGRTSYRRPKREMSKRPSLIRLIHARRRSTKLETSLFRNDQEETAFIVVSNLFFILPKVPIRP
ncbi:MAG TPA: hypothetical protein DCX67_03545 [Opitutae bacterium]|nr:hypothetical protein [Opitutae bacterium]